MGWCDRIFGAHWNCKQATLAKHCTPQRDIQWRYLLSNGQHEFEWWTTTVELVMSSILYDWEYCTCLIADSLDRFYLVNFRYFHRKLHFFSVIWVVPLISDDDVQFREHHQCSRLIIDRWRCIMWRQLLRQESLLSISESVGKERKLSFNEKQSGKANDCRSPTIELCFALYFKILLNVRSRLRWL